MNRKPGSEREVFGEAVNRLVCAAVEDPRVRALWLEAPSREELRPPYRSLEVHLAADEPDFGALLADLPGMLAGPAGLEAQGWSDVPRFARELKAVLEGAPVTVVVEKTSLLAKRRRTAVSCLVDKSGHLYHVMDFSGAGRDLER